MKSRGVNFQSSVLIIFLLSLFTYGKVYELRAESLYQAAKRAYSSKDYKKAMDLFGRATQAWPSDGNSYYYIGRIYSDQKKISKSIQYFEKAVHLRMDRNLKEQALWKILLYHRHNKNWNKLYTYSGIFLQSSKSNKKVQRYRDLAESRRSSDHSIDYTSKMNAASDLVKSGKISGAIEKYSEILSRDSAYHPARWKMALLLMKVNKYSAANGHFKYLSDSDKPDWEYNYKSAICHYRLDEPSLSLQEISKAEKNNKNKSRIFLYHSNYLKGKIYLNSYLYQDSCKAFTIANKNRSGNSEKFLSYYALAKLECGQLKSANASALKVLKINPESGMARLVKTRLFLSSGKKKTAYKSALHLLNLIDQKKMINLHPGYTPAFFFLGKEASRNKKYLISKKAFLGVNIERLTIDTKTARLENRKNDSLWDYNYYYGLALLNTNEIDRSIILFDKLQKNERSWYLLAKANARKKNFVLAKKYLINSTNINSKRWQIAEQDSDFTQLMKKNPDFRQFILTRNQPVEKKKVR